MDSSHQNWLAFSLSNQYSLLQAFNHHSPSGVAEENGSGGGTTLAEDLTMLNNNNSPKLADFLGSGGQIIGSASSSAAVAAVAVTATAAEIYESELKTIAASFIRGYSADQQVDCQKQLAVVPPPDPMAKKAVDTFGQRTSIYRGVTRHRWTGRYEAHLWDNTCRREGQSRKGRQVYLGGYDKEDKAARAYDLAALKYWGPTTTTNFPIINYEKELEEMKNMTRQEFVASLRRRSSGFSRGASIYRGVTRHHQHGRWQARIGRVAGNKDLYLGTFSTQEEAAEAYDIAAIKFRGLNAVTNFDMSRYDVKSIATSNLPIGGMTNKTKTSLESVSDNKSGEGSQSVDDHDHMSSSSSTSIALVSQPSTSTLGYGLPVKQDTWDFWSSIGYHNTEFNNNIPRGDTTIYQTNPNCTSLPFNLSEHNKNHHSFYDTNAVAAYSEHQQQQQNNNGGGCTTGVSSDQLGHDNQPNTMSYGNWISPSIHSFQSAKPNLSVIHTAIFGIE